MPYISLAKPPRQWAYAEWNEQPVTLVVIEPENTPVDTGLFDSAGVKIFSFQEKGKLGFHGKKDI